MGRMKGKMPGRIWRVCILESVFWQLRLGKCKGKSQGRLGNGGNLGWNGRAPLLMPLFLALASPAKPLGWALFSDQWCEAETAPYICIGICSWQSVTLLGSHIPIEEWGRKDPHCKDETLEAQRTEVTCHRSLSPEMGTCRATGASFQRQAKGLPKVCGAWVQTPECDLRF